MELLQELMVASKLEPVLVDVGAAGYVQDVFTPLAPFSTLIGFEPDARDPAPGFGHGFKKSIMVPKAVVDTAVDGHALFYLTERPTCSSTLKPDLDSLCNHLFHDFFVVKDTARVGAISLNDVVKENSLGKIDWLKIDSQGADLKIIKGLNQSLRDGLLIVDVEPGVIDAYQTEDLFVDIHNYMTEIGFWLSFLQEQNYPRVHVDTRKMFLTKYTFDELLMALGASPAAIEARYFRTIKHLMARDERDVMLSGVFAILLKKYGHAYDVARLYKSRFGENSKYELYLKLLSSRFESSLSFAKTQKTIDRVVGKFRGLKRKIERGLQ